MNWLFFGVDEFMATAERFRFRKGQNYWVKDDPRGQEYGQFRASLLPLGCGVSVEKWDWNSEMVVRRWRLTMTIGDFKNWAADCA